MITSTFNVTNAALRVHDCVAPATVTFNFTGLSFSPGEFIYKIEAFFNDDQVTKTINYIQTVENNALTIRSVQSQQIEYTFDKIGYYTVTFLVYTIGRSTPYKLLSFVNATAARPLENLELVNSYSNNINNDMVFVFNADLPIQQGYADNEQPFFINKKYLIPVKGYWSKNLCVIGTEIDERLRTETDRDIAINNCIPNTVTQPVDISRYLGCGTLHTEERYGKIVFVSPYTDTFYGTLKIGISSEKAPANFSISLNGSAPINTGYIGDASYNDLLVTTYNTEAAFITSADISLSALPSKDNDQQGLIIEADAPFVDTKYQISLQCVPSEWRSTANVLPAVTSVGLIDYSTSLNYVGDIIAIGGTASTSTTTGLVKVFKYNSTTSSTYQLGYTISGTDLGDGFGFDVVLNKAGDVLATSSPFSNSSTGKVNIYKWNGLYWQQQGSLPVTGSVAGELAGYSIDINSTGDILVVGSPGKLSNKGSVTVYVWDGVGWNQRGTSLSGSNANDRFGVSVSIDSIGNTILIGADGDGSSPLHSGFIETYKWDGNIADWTLVGTRMYGLAAGDRFGSAVSINTSGNIIASAAKNSRYAKVYKLQSNVWTQLGADIYNTTGTVLSRKIDTNAEGTRIAIGTEASTTSFNSKVKVFQWFESMQSWVQVGTDISGSTSSSAAPSISLNGTGEIISVIYMLNIT